VEGQPSLLDEEWGEVSMHVEDFEPKTMITSIPSKRGLFLKTIGAEVGTVWDGEGEHACHHIILHVR